MNKFGLMIPKVENHDNVMHQCKQRGNRSRTWSSDSGCEVGCDHTRLITNTMDESIQSWADMLEKVVSLEVSKAKEIISWAKYYEGKFCLLCPQDVTDYPIGGTDEEEEVDSCKRQVGEIMDSTTAMVEAVNSTLEDNICRSFDFLADNVDTIEKKQKRHEAFSDGVIERDRGVTKIMQNDLEETEKNKIETDIFDDWDWSSIEFNEFEQITVASTLKDYKNLYIKIKKEDLIAWKDPNGEDLLMEYKKTCQISPRS